ncbi:hypothetical protein Sjap_005641 [Stephania japonica]|uniref:Protein TILLER ANGLE CONTROL 1 n=1 Tax=Stephania japonica TaxID=461633 RepID=A0AAP0K4G7_9MAGN
MKIFNWVHRKFHHGRNSNGYILSHKNVDDLACYYVKKSEAVTNEADTEALLLDQVTDLIDVWKDGILAIGTLGFDPLKPTSNDQFNYFEERDNVDDEDDKKLEDDQEVCRGIKDHKEGELMNPLVVKAFKREIEKVLLCPSNADIVVTKSDMVRISVDETDMPLLPFFELPELKCEVEEKEKNNKKRMTLADLFSAEPNVDGKVNPSEATDADSGKKAGCHSKNGTSFAKKLMPRKGSEESRPVKKLQKMITKMLKKKIHPELEGKEVEAKEGSSGPSKTVMPSEGCPHKATNGNGTMESVSLLREVVTQC